VSELLDGAKLAAIARLERRAPGFDPKLLGTGFVVDDGRVLTARHVVRGFDRPAPPAGETLWVKLRGAESAGKVVAWGSTPQLDWALIECDAAKGRAPLLLRRVPYGASEWVTFGYSRESGEYLGGALRAARGAELDLETRQLVDRGGKTVKGASGSPVIAFGVVVGMLVKEVRDLDTDVNVNQAVTALASEAIVGDAGGALSLEIGEVPFTAAFASELRKVPDAWDGVGKELGVPPGGDPATSLARALVAGGLVKIRKALQGVRVDSVLFEIAEALWVNDQAAKALHDRIQQPGAPRAIGLDAKTIPTGLHYVLRAEASSVKQFPTWYKRALEYQLVSDELTGQPLADELVDRLRARVGSDKETDEDVNDWLETHGPIVLLIASEAPLPPGLPAELEALERRFPRVCALVLVGAEREPPAPMALIEPRLAPKFNEARLHKRIRNTQG
jgi:hypothetical protein